VKRALYLATAVFIPGGLIAVPLLWWLERRKAPAAPHPEKNAGASAAGPIRL